MLILWLEEDSMQVEVEVDFVDSMLVLVKYKLFHLFVISKSVVNI